MKAPIPCIIIALSLLLVSVANAIPPDVTVTRLMQSAESSDISAQDEKLFSSEDVLSTKQAFLMSLVLPGAGEFYSRSYIKAGVFFGAEAAFWAGFFYYMHQYSVKEDEFKRYADEHWWEDYWRDWYDSLCTIADTNELGIEILPDTKTQQYYEMIGKYDWFVLGWDDVIERDDYLVHLAATYTIAINNSDDPSSIHSEIVSYLGQNVHSDRMDHYMKMRSDANEQYTIAKYFIGAAIINHVLSAFDAAWTAKRHNDKLYEGFTGIRSIDVRPAVSVRGGKPMPQITLTLRW